MMAYWRAQGLINSAPMDSSLARRLAITTSPLEWASRGAEFLDQRKYEVGGVGVGWGAAWQCGAVAVRGCWPQSRPLLLAWHEGVCCVWHDCQ
jgi:hypothetical protein